MSETWAFRAVDNVGGAVRGEIETGSRDAAIHQLSARGLTVLEVKKRVTASGLSIDLNASMSRVKRRDLAIMSRQLATMVSSGLTLLRTLYVLEEQVEHPKLREAIAVVRRDVETGSSLSGAMAAHPKVFNQLYIAMVRAGETGGFLEDALLRVADHLESEASLQRQVRSAMVYPIAVISFALIVLTAMITFIVPVFAKIFTSQGAKLPGLTQVTLSISHTFRGYPIEILGGLIASVLGFRYWKNSEDGRKQWDALRLRAPMHIGEIVRKIALARWSRTLSSLVSAGVPMLEAIDVTAKTAGNFVVENAMNSVRASVQAGGTISAALSREPVFPPMVRHMVGVGEETGALEKTLAKVADFYEDEVAVAVKTLTSILEPAMIVIVGGIVGFVVVSMYLPMFDVYNAIH